MSNVVEISQEAGKMLIPPLSRQLNSQASPPRFIPRNFVFWGHPQYQAPFPPGVKVNWILLHPPLEPISPKAWNINFNTEKGIFYCVGIFLHLLKILLFTHTLPYPRDN